MKPRLKTSAFAPRAGPQSDVVTGSSHRAKPYGAARPPAIRFLVAPPRTLPAAVTKGLREAIADWLMLLGAPILFMSLFLSWSHQFSPAFLTQYGNTPALEGIPHNPTAWQVYSIVDVLIAVLAAALLAAALRGSRNWRIAVLLGLLVALAFTLHALGTPPTHGANLFDPSLRPPAYTPDHPTSGAGELVALLGLGLGICGVLVSFTAD